MRGGLVALATTLLLPAMLTAQQQTIGNGSIRSGTLSFDGRATMGDFTGSTSSVSGVMQGAPDLSGVTGWVEAPVTTLKTANDRRDRDLNKSMESEKYPAIRFDLERVEPGTGSPDSLPVTLHGRLLIHGVSREVSLPALVSRQASTVQLRSTFPLNLKDYQIGGLSKMLGMLKMHPDIVVHVDVIFGLE